MTLQKKLSALALALCIGAGIVSGCSSGQDTSPREEEGTVFILGDTTFNSENEEPDVNPHNAYSGWACIRYGIGETLSATPIPWKSSPGWQQTMSGPTT